MFKVGDRVKFHPVDSFYVRFEGALGTVGARGIYSQSWGGPYVDIVWDNSPVPGLGDGGYYPAQFEMLFKVGDRVRVVSDDSDFEGNHVGEVGKIVVHDGCDEGMWPWHVEFSDDPDDYEIYNARDLELAPPEAKVEPKVLYADLEETYIEGYLVVDDSNHVLTVFDTYAEAYKEAKEASEELGEPLFIYQMMTAFEVGANEIYHVV